MNGTVFKKPMIHTLAAVVPQKTVPLLEYADVFGEEDIRKISKVTGIEEVCVSDPTMTGSDYCCIAAERIFSETGVGPADIDALIYVTETPDYLTPGTGPIIQNRLGIPKNTINFELRYSCMGFVYGLFEASLLIETGCCKKVLLMAGNTGTRLIHPLDRSLRMLTGDACCAALITPSEMERPTQFSFFVDGSGTKSLYIPAGGMRMPAKRGETDQIIYDDDGNGRTLENVQMNGMDIMTFSLHEVPKLITGLLRDTGWKKEDVDMFALHQANEMIVTRVAKALKVGMDKVPVSLAHTGNTGLISIPLMLCNSYAGVHPELKRVVMCGFGSGLLAAACATTLTDTHIIETIEA